MKSVNSKKNFNQKKSETKFLATILKEDPNTQKLKKVLIAKGQHKKYMYTVSG